MLNTLHLGEVIAWRTLVYIQLLLGLEQRNTVRSSDSPEPFTEDERKLLECRTDCQWRISHDRGEGNLLRAEPGVPVALGPTDTMDQVVSVLRDNGFLSELREIKENEEYAGATVLLNGKTMVIKRMLFELPGRSQPCPCCGKS